MGKLVGLAAIAAHEAAWTVAQIADTTNYVVNLVTIALVLVFAVPAIRSRRKDGTIADLEHALSGKETRLQEAEKELLGAQARADAAEERAHMAEKREAECRAKYEEMQKYTAQPAFEELHGAIKKLVDQQIAFGVQSQDRHKKTIDLIRMLAGEKSVTDG